MLKVNLPGWFNWEGFTFILVDNVRCCDGEFSIVEKEKMSLFQILGRFIQ